MIDARPRTLRIFPALLLTALLLPAAAGAQSLGSRPAIGENYRVEISASWWKPKVIGIITSDRLDLIGSRVDFVTDLGFEETRFRDLKVVVRPGIKHKIRVQYTPIAYEASANFSRDIVFNGIKFPVSIPVESRFEWKILRVGFQYDVVSNDRGFVGFLLEGRYTQFRSELTSVLSDEFTVVKAPLPSVLRLIRA